jgi:hypothetical protein
MAMLCLEMTVLLDEEYHLTVGLMADESALRTTRTAHLGVRHEEA